MFAAKKNIIFQFYKHHIMLFLKLTTLLIFIGFFERSVFAIFHNHLSTAYSPAEIIYTLLWGLKFDIALAGIFGIIYILSAYLLQRIFSISETVTLKYLVYIFASIVYFLQGADIIYFSDASRHLGYEITDTFNDAPELLATAWSVYTVPLFTHLAIYPILLFIIYKFFNHEKNIQTQLSGFNKIHLESVYFLLLIFSLILGRGGFQSIPISPLHAQEISDSTKASLALNGAYNALFYALNKSIIKPVPIKIPESLDIDLIVKNMYKTSGKTSNNDSNWKPNIIFIFLESWPAMYMHSYGYDKNTTPFFDKLREKSLTSVEMIAGGHRTTEGLYTSLCSAQNPLGQTVAQSQLQEYKYQCLPHSLREIGYKTAFFQGSNKNTSGTGAFAQSLGFRESYGKADIKIRKYEENYWGVYDQDLYEHVYKSLKDTRSPVFIGINTNTTHDITLPDGVKPQFKMTKSVPAIINPLYFSDIALKEFFNKVENDKEIKDTLWVIVADHTSGVKSSRLNNYRVPFLIYHKDKVKPKLVNRVASQRDISPTILDILNIPPPKNFTGKSLKSNNNPPYFSDYYHSGILGWIENNLLLEISVSNSANFSCFDYINDKLLTHKIDCPKNIEIKRNRAIAFTAKSQKSLFSGNKINSVLMTNNK